MGQTQQDTRCPEGSFHGAAWCVGSVLSFMTRRQRLFCPSSLLAPQTLSSRLGHCVLSLGNASYLQRLTLLPFPGPLFCLWVQQTVLTVKALRDSALENEVTAPPPFCYYTDPLLYLSALLWLGGVGGFTFKKHIRNVTLHSLCPPACSLLPPPFSLPILPQAPETTTPPTTCDFQLPEATPGLLWVP